METLMLWLIAILLILIPLALIVWLIVWVVAGNRKDEKELKEFKERLRKAKPLTGTAKEVFIGTYCAKSLY